MDLKAFDTSENSTRYIAAMREQGVAAIGRYYTRNKNHSKILTKSEAEALSRASIAVWTVYQIRHRQASDFSAVKGASEADDALTYGRDTIGQPQGSAIYFSVDYDVSEEDYNTHILPHFAAISATFKSAGNPYRIGIYGSGYVCRMLSSAGLVQLTWLSQSSGFRETMQFSASRRWNIKQRMPVSGFCNFDDDVDPDDTQGADFGAFLLQSNPPANVLAAAAEDRTLLAVSTNTSFAGVPLERGDLGSSQVQLVQKRLNDLGFGPLVTDGDFGEATQNAVFHFQARNSAPDGHPLPITGVVDTQTWASMFGPGAVYASANLNVKAEIRDLLIDIAASQIGVVEQPVGSNRGPEVDQYIRRVGLDPAADAYPWCVAFLYWVFDEAARLRSVANPLPKTAGVISLWRLSGKSDATVVRSADVSASLIKPGMIFLYDLGGGKGHAGLIIGVNATTVTTIEGNTNNGGSREGYGVFRRSSRPLSTSVLLGYVDYCPLFDIPVA